MNPLTRRLLAVSGAAVLGLGLAAPAQAQVVGRTDATGDVTVSTCDSNDENCTDVLAPTAKQPDIIRAVSSHTSTQVKAFVKYAELGPAGTRLHQMRVVTGAGRHVRLTLVTVDGRMVVRDLTRDSDNRKIACSGLVAKVDNSLNTVLLSVPRSCIGNPGYVRVGFGGAIFNETNWRSDDANVSGISSSSTDLKLGPSLRRG